MAESLTEDDDAIARFRRAAGFWLVGLRTSEEIVDAAACALVEGLDTPKLRILAGVPRRDATSDVPDLLRWTYEELALGSLPDRETDDARLVGATEIAKAILDGELAPSSGAFQIYTVFLPEYPTVAMPFLRLSDEYGLVPDFTHRTFEQIDNAVRQQAQLLIGTG